MFRLLTVTIIRLLTKTRKGNVTAAVAVTDGAGTGLIRNTKSCVDCSMFVTSGGVNEVRALLAIYEAYNGSFLPAFRANLSVPSSKVEQPA